MKFVPIDLDDPMRFPKSVRREVAKRQEEGYREYREHHDQVRPRLPVGLQLLCDFSLDDALLEWLRIDPAAGTVEMQLLAGDSQVGMWRLKMLYGDVVLTPTVIQTLCLVAAVGTDIYYGEIDLLEEESWPIYIHRMLWHSNLLVGREGTTKITLRPELELRFGNFRLDKRRCTGRKSNSKRERIQIVRPVDQIEGFNDDPNHRVLMGGIYSL